MAFFHGNIFSKSIGMETQLYVSMPHDGRQYSGDGNPKTLILLHGISDNASGWARRSQADYFAEKYGISIFIPEVQRSFYQDMFYGGRYYEYISSELPELIQKMFKISTERENLMVAGLSMGGYGAMRVAFGNPDRFSRCGAFSAACDLRNMLLNKEDLIGVGDVGDNIVNEFIATFGPDFVLHDDSDLYKLVEKVSKQSKKPSLYLTCGTEDIVYQMNADFASYCKGLPFDFIYEEWPGMHDWDFWNPSLEKFLKRFLPLAL